jgi:hypothetical protein
MHLIRQQNTRKLLFSGCLYNENPARHTLGQLMHDKHRAAMYCFSMDKRARSKALVTSANKSMSLLGTISGVPVVSGWCMCYSDLPEDWKTNDSRFGYQQKRD